MCNSHGIIAKVAKKILRCDSLARHSVVVGSHSVVYYPADGFLSMTDLLCLASIAEKSNLHYYVSADTKGVFFSMYLLNLIF